MKRFILIILGVVALNFSSEAGWFSNHDAEQKEKERREHAEQQLVHVQDTNRRMEVIILVLSVSCVLAPGIGAAVGARTRSAEQGHE
jgi:hypothetical protein